MGFSLVAPFSEISGHITTDFPASEVCHQHEGYPGAGETVTVTCEGPAPPLARYVYINTNINEPLTLCEVEVYGGYTGI